MYNASKAIHIFVFIYSFLFPSPFQGEGLGVRVALPRPSTALAYRLAPLWADSYANNAFFLNAP